MSQITSWYKCIPHKNINMESFSCLVQIYKLDISSSRPLRNPHNSKVPSFAKSVILKWTHEQIKIINACYRGCRWSSIRCSIFDSFLWHKHNYSTSDKVVNINTLVENLVLAYISSFPKRREDFPPMSSPETNSSSQHAIMDNSAGSQLGRWKVPPRWSIICDVDTSSRQQWRNNVNVSTRATLNSASDVGLADWWSDMKWTREANSLTST